MAITGESREKGLGFSGAVNEPCCGYDEILNLVAESTGDYLSLPGELIVEILCKLPVKSLVPFKTVCKPWKLLINSRVFIQKHLHRPNPQLGGYAARRGGKVDNTFPLPTLSIIFIVGACNGILCLCAYINRGYLILLNPATREFSFVRHAPPGWAHVVFCYLPKTEEYQLVFFAYSQGGTGLTHVDITTLTLGKLPSARVVKNVGMPGEIANSRHAACGTTMYWFGLDDQREIVICYDVVEGRFSEMSMPPSSFSLDTAHKSIGVFKDSVIMFATPMEEFFDIWILVEDVLNRKSWMKYRRIGPLGGVVYPFEVCWDDRWILCKNNNSLHLDDYIKKNLFYYDLETNQVVDYCDFQPDQVKDCKETYPPIVEFVNYVESLVPINSLIPCVDTNIS